MPKKRQPRRKGVDVPEKCCLAERMKQLRIAALWSQYDLARICQTKQKVISNYETGSNYNMSLALAWRLADAFGVSIDVLVGREDITAEMETEIRRNSFLGEEQMKVIKQRKLSAATTAHYARKKTPDIWEDEQKILSEETIPS